jgi:hypothetical protein
VNLLRVGRAGPEFLVRSTLLGKEESLRRFDVRKLLAGEHLRNPALIDAKDGSNLVIEELLLVLEVSNFRSH